MNIQELVKLRREYMALCAVLGPEFKVEIARMEELQKQTADAAAIVGTAKDAEKLRLSAGGYVQDQKDKADKLLADAQQVQELANEQAAKLDAREATLDARSSALTTAERTHEAAVREFDNKVSSTKSALADAQRTLDMRAAALDKKEQDLVTREQDLKTRLKKMHELVA